MPPALVLRTPSGEITFNDTEHVYLILGKPAIVGDTVAGSQVTPGNTSYIYTSLIFGGGFVVVLLLALLIYYRFCRHKEDKKNLTIRIEDRALNSDARNYVIAEDNAARDAEEAGFPYEPNPLYRITPPQLHLYASPHDDELEDTLVISNGVTSLRQGDEHGKSCLVLQKQRTFANESPVHSLSINKQLQSRTGCQVAVDVHIDDGGRVASGPLPLPTSSRQQQYSPQCRGWTESDENRDDTIEIVNARGRGEFQPPDRTSVSDLSLQTRLNFWQQRHSTEASCPHLEDDCRSKVRYNDTGSLEELGRSYQDYTDQERNQNYAMPYAQYARQNQRQYDRPFNYMPSEAVDVDVNVVNVADKVVEGGSNADSEADDREGVKNRRLWQLRTHLEINEGRSATAGSPYRFGTARRFSTPAPIITRPYLQYQSSPDLSPVTDRDIVTSGVDRSYYESSSGTAIDDNSGARMPAPDPFPPQHLSYEARKQNYRSSHMPNLRLQTTSLQSRYSRYPIRQAPVDDSTDTEGSTIPDPRKRASFDCMMNVKRGINDNPIAFQHQTRRQPLGRNRSDSGYRSEDHPCKPLAKVKYMISIPSVGEETSEGETESASVEVDDEGVAGLMQMQTANRRASASTKRRDFGRQNEYPRDYSVDEKSDALFREFSRCDTPPLTQQQKLRDYRRHRQPGHYSHSKLNLRSEDDYGLYMDDDFTYGDCISTVPIICVAPEEDQDLSDKL